jgi:hypothetical protein
MCNPEYHSPHETHTIAVLAFDPGKRVIVGSRQLIEPFGQSFNRSSYISHRSLASKRDEVELGKQKPTSLGLIQ